MLPDTAAADGLRHLIEHIQDAVVAFELTEDGPIVRGVNEAFIDQFGYDREALLGSDLNERIVPPWLRAEAAALDRRTENGEVNYRRVQRQTASGLREFLYRGVPYPDAGGSVDGYAVYTDLTETTRRERQLKVLNRLLRHNLRNKAAVIGGNVELLRTGIESDNPELLEAAERAAEAAADLRNLGEEAGKINRIFDTTPVDTNGRDIVPIIHSAAADFRDRYPEALVRTEISESVPVVVTTGFRDAIEALIENAIEHNPVDRPQVVVRIGPGPEDGWIDLTVEDDGPIIPAADRDVITGAAEITQTCHGRGLGLWLIKWTVERSGGQLSFDRSEMGGNSVRLRFRKAD